MMRRLGNLVVLAAMAGMISGVPVMPLMASDLLSDSPGASTLADDGSRDRIVDAIQRKYHARVVKVTEIVVEGRRVYALRLLSDERVWVVRVDAETGREVPGGD
jgi:hypothetical protein